MEIGTRIKDLRTERHLSQEALAERLGLSRQAVAKWESGTSAPSTANLLALCGIFGVSLDELTSPDSNGTDLVCVTDGTLGERIKTLRLERHWSQEALADKLELSRQAVAKWESGASAPSTANLLALGQLFGVPFTQLAPPEPEDPKKPARHWTESTLLRLILTIASTILITLSFTALFRPPLTLPFNVIGYADGPTAIWVTGNQEIPYPLYALTGLMTAFTVYVFLQARHRNEKEVR